MRRRSVQLMDVGARNGPAFVLPEFPRPGTMYLLPKGTNPEDVFVPVRWNPFWLDVVTWLDEAALA